jgi:uncharacterized protein (TIGR00369 family)
MTDPFASMRTLPNGGTHRCFACSPLNPKGLRMTFFTDDVSVFSRLTLPEHLSGYTQVAHGGIVATLLDEVMGWASMYLLKKITMTKTLNLTFHKSVYVGEPLMVEGRVLETLSRREALIEGRLTDAAGDLCAQAEGRFTLASPAAARRMGIVSPEDLAGFFEPLLEAGR